MESLTDLLISRLSDRGIGPHQVPGLMRDIMNIIGPGGDFTVPMINERLASLGWEEKVMDEYTFDLMIWFLEEMEAYEVIRQNQH